MSRNNNGFKVAKILNSGTANPIVNRLSLQFFEILKSNLLLITNKTRVRNFIFTLIFCQY